MNESWKRIITMILFAILLGIPGCGMALGDLGKGPTIADWAILVVVYFLFAGIMLGLMDAEYWFLSIAVAWGPVAVGAIMLFFHLGRQPYNPANILAPILSSALGGLLGAAARAKIGAR